MRFFTPDLYARFSAADDATADAADAAWEHALADYRAHLDGIRDRLPAPARAVADLDLHDAELLACDQVCGPAEPSGAAPAWPPLAVVSVRKGGQITTLIYLLGDRVRESAAAGWPFSKARTHWLYDEIDLAPGDRGGFLHRILLSDGRVLEIPFRSVFVQGLPLSPPAEGVRVRQSA